MLDTQLAKASPDAQARFGLMLRTEPSPGQLPQEPSVGSHREIEREERAAENGSESGYPARITHPVDGKAMVLVGVGSFPSGPSNQEAWLPDFYLDVYPTTNDDYARFVAATGHGAPRHWVDGKFPGELASHPVVNVTHQDAEAYARWARKALPSALEWEKAARGPRGNMFPWGNQGAHAKCNVRQTGIGGTTPVGRYHSGVSDYDVYDLSGNVWEWCRTETDPGRFVLKGSAFTSPLSMASGASMNDASRTMLDDDTGFRCSSPVDVIRELLGLPAVAHAPMRT
jgi:formylglycine-generating enzyme required for sulfatase activity